jgi:hypothetical protein
MAPERPVDGAPGASLGAGRRRVDVIAAIRAGWAGEPGLFAVGAAGVVLALVCLVGMAARGRTVPPEGKLLDAATFCFGVGVFTLTVALLLPLAGYSAVGRRRWRRAYYVFVVYGLVLESLQAFRGLDPRFTEEGGSVDVVAGIVFGITALLNTILFVILGLRFFRADTLADRPLLRLGIRYGAAAVWLSFAVGIIMSINSGRHVGDDGNLLLSHAIGVHGIQTVPAVALLVTWAAIGTRAMSWVHLAGIGWLTACAAALVQALLGQAPLEPSILTGLTVAGLTGWAASAVHSLIAWRVADRHQATSSSPY